MLPNSNYFNSRINVLVNNIYRTVHAPTYPPVYLSYLQSVIWNTYYPHHRSKSNWDLIVVPIPRTEGATRSRHIIKHIITE